MTDTPPPPVAPPAAPAPRRSRLGEVVVGPTVGARYVPGALIGLPLVSVALSPFAAIAVQSWRRSRLLGGHDGPLESLLSSAGAQLLVGALLMWALLSLWAVVPLVLTHRVVLFAPDSGRLRLRRGLRTAETASLPDVLYAVGEPERSAMALIGVRDAAAPESSPRDWVIPAVGWDAASFDGLRVLQEAAGLRPSPPRDDLLTQRRRRRRALAHRELADRLGMPWHEHYAQDEAAFQAEFDRVRRVLGGKETPREGDPRPGE